MKRLLRWTLTSAAAVSAVLFVATGVVWIRSLWVPERLGWYAVGPERDGFVARQWVIWSSKGGVAVWEERDWIGGHELDIQPHGWFYDVKNVVATYPYMTGGFAENRLGFRFFDLQTTVREVGAIVPYWCPVALFAVLPAVWMVRVGRTCRTRRRDRAGRCYSCGYDLRATSDRCPECGAVAKRAGL